MKNILTAILLTFVFAAGAVAAESDLPAGCEHIAVPEGSKLVSVVYATGVQIYRWNGTSWAFVGPSAGLFADQSYSGKLGTHYATPVGPAWEGNSGGRVIAQRLQGCSPDASAIDWLLLGAVANEGPGIFKNVTHIQRLNTVGGKAPAQPGTAGEEARVPYTTEYYFYRAN